MDAILTLLLLLTLSAFGTANTVTHFEDNLMKYLETHGYKSSVVGVMKNGELLYAKGLTLTTDSKLSGNPEKLRPLGSLSESLTAIAVLKLCKNGNLRLNDRVFGERGVLKHLTPYTNRTHIDPHIYSITVADLLRHASGWDATKSPVLDPALNSFYLKKGVKVIDIASELGVLGELKIGHIIRYMMNQELHFAPGTKSVNSLFHYSVLSEVIETASKLEYKKFVKKYVLELCGMWNTRIGFKHHPSGNTRITDASRGWYSNVYDILRLIRCIEGTGRLRILSEELLSEITVSHNSMEASTTWQGAGFTVNRHAAFWKVASGGKSNAILWNSGIQHPNTTRKSRLSFVILLESEKAISSVNRHKVCEIFRSVNQWSNQNHFTNDLTDVSLVHNGLVKLGVQERHVKAFVNALKSEYYDVTWISATHGSRDTRFNVIARRNVNGENYIFESGLTKDSMYHHRKFLQSYNYRLAFLQSYISQSHSSKYRYLALSRKNTEKMSAVIGTHFTNEQYKQVFKDNLQKGYVPNVQSITYKHGRINNDFIFVKATSGYYKSYVNVHLEDIENLVEDNAKSNRVLNYLDVTEVDGKPRFSAIFKECKDCGGHLYIYLNQTRLLATVEKDQAVLFTPTLIVEYTLPNKNHSEYILYLTKVNLH